MVSILTALVGVGVGSSFGAGCAAGSTSSTAPSGEASSETTTTETASADPTETAPTAPHVKTSSPAGSSNPAEETREITASECDALSQKYEELTISDQMAKEVSSKLTDAQRDQARKNIGVGAHKLATNWREGCVRDLTGKLANEQSLKCAMAAKTVAAFETCLNGPAK